MLSEFIDSILNKNILYSNELIKINEYIKDILSKIDIPNDMYQIIVNSGKRIRSLLAVDIYYRYNRSIPEYLYKVLALVELVHFGSLLHDDVIDQNNIRRMRQSCYCIHGAKQSILLGDYLLAKIFGEISKLPVFVVKRFINIASSTAHGACLEQRLKTSSSFQDYIKVISLKTASLFQFSATIGLWNTDNVVKIGTYATCFGIVYQVQNDLNSYYCNVFTDSEDYMQDNITLPLIILFPKYAYLFRDKNQRNFDCIKDLCHSTSFQHSVFSKMSRYLKCLTNSNIYIEQ